MCTLLTTTTEARRGGGRGQGACPRCSRSPSRDAGSDPLPVSLSGRVSLGSVLVTAPACPAGFHPRRCESTWCVNRGHREQTGPRAAAAAPRPEAARPYLRMPGRRPRGGTSRAPCPCPGGASGQGLRTWTYPIWTRRRTRTHLKGTEPESVGCSAGCWPAPSGARGPSCQRSLPPPPHPRTRLRCRYPQETAENQGSVQSRDRWTQSAKGAREREPHERTSTCISLSGTSARFPQGDCPL